MSYNSIKLETLWCRTREGAPWTYADADRLQKKIQQDILSGKRDRGVILFSEFSPIITLGKRKTDHDLLLAPEEYRKQGIDLLEINRGGRATYHGPGQWVIFVIDRLENLVGDRKGVRKVTCALLDSLREVIRERFPEAEIREGDQVGVWESSAPNARKIASIGIQIENGILQHGVAVNVFSTPESFFGIHPCGIAGAKPGFLEVAPNEQAFSSWGERFDRALQITFSE